jgi:uncharacterized membrane protein YagU involved in acid resistance
MAIWRGIVAGLVGGTIAAGAMSLVHRGLVGLISATQPSAPATKEQEGEDATVRVADGITRWLLGRALPEEKKPLASNIVHFAFGASVGGLYGGVATVAPRVTLAHGVPFGVAVWLGAHVIMVPALGLAPPLPRQPPAKEALECVLHLVYGAVTEVVRRLLWRAP